ncbi:glutathione S-transferase family protein [Nostoc sp. 106C]|uniref:glutathione S-transferase family protein n=1 Tax=Nostoc sp. 106C TaxID=1932667 RepID=UPI000A39FD56|nr:glutathione S-transferase family protein [Nostoc sp. 106C]OUL36065.1 glutathione S-transferase [Nostoc sp. 106C]
MLKLYGGTRSRASIIEWYLEELGIPYEFVLLDMQSGEHRKSEYLKINPMGKVPAIVDGDFQIWESGAILLYLADKYGKTPLSPELRGVLYQWVLFANATLGPGIFGEENREQEMPRLLTPLNNIFEQQPFLLGNEFSAADVAVGSILSYSLLLLKLDLSSYPAVLDYVKRMSERPAFSIGKRA